MLGFRVLSRFLARVRRAAAPSSPSAVNWDLTYACPLRCGHCYSDSGRRPARQLPFESLLHIADELLKVRPVPAVTFTGGEPLVVRRFLEVAQRLRRGGAHLTLYTSGYRLSQGTARGVAESFDRVAVSLDGPDAATNDFLRERAGAFDEALRAAEMLDRLVPTTRKVFALGLEVTVMKTNWPKLDWFVTRIAPRLAHLSYLHFGALIPTGLASRETFVERELLDDSQMAELPALEKRLRRIAPGRVKVRVFSNLPFLMHPEQIRRGMALDRLIKIEADGRVRGMDIYEGTVGNLLEEPMSVLFPRALARHSDPFVKQQLSAVLTMRDWARACRAIDLHFASAEDRARIEGRGMAAPLPVELRRPGAPPTRTARRPLDLFS